jgi:hypothetical protein
MTAFTKDEASAITAVVAYYDLTLEDRLDEDYDDPDGKAAIKSQQEALRRAHQKVLSNVKGS